MQTDIPVTQSAVIAYRRRWWRVQMVLITSLGTRRWVLPKGNIEPDLTAGESAMREAFEEAGLEGVIAGDSIGTYQYTKVDNNGGGDRRVAVFPMEITRVLHDWPEQHMRRRKWIAIRHAAEAVDEPDLRELLLRFGRELRGD